MDSTVDDPDTLMKRVSQLRDVAKYVTDTKALTVIEELIAELLAKADSLRRRNLH
ncbi:MAG TPA: hypothetical protein VMQ11_17300 [Alphaproteobacteria bacterium]|nr:hypothetical protein [Alphaproteobacteria bacterium]